jgi:hypothetical protein
MSNNANGTNLKNLLKTNIYNNGWTIESIFNEFIDNSYDAHKKRNLDVEADCKLQITVSLDKHKKQLVITDQGVGMNDTGINQFITLYETSKTDLSENNTGRFGIGGIAALGYLVDLDNSVQIISKPINERNVYQCIVNFKDIMSSGRHTPNATPAIIDIYELYESYMGNSHGTVIIIDLSPNKFDKLHKMFGLEQADEFESDFLDKCLPFLYDEQVFPYEIVMKVLDGTTSYHKPLNSKTIRMIQLIDLHHNTNTYREYRAKICKTVRGNFDLCDTEDPNKFIEGNKKTDEIIKNNKIEHDQVINIKIGYDQVCPGIYIRRNGRTITKAHLPEKRTGHFKDRRIPTRCTFIISYKSDKKIDDTFCVEMNKSRVNTNGSTETTFYPDLKEVLTRICKERIISVLNKTTTTSNPPQNLSSENEEDNDNSSQEYSGKKEKKSRSSKKSFKDYIIKCTASPSNEIQVYKGDTLIKTLYFPMGHSIASSMRDTIIALGTEQTDTQFMNTLECLHSATLPHKQS